MWFNKINHLVEVPDEELVLGLQSEVLGKMRIVVEVASGLSKKKRS